MIKPRTGRVLPGTLKSGRRGLWAMQDQMAALTQKPKTYPVWEEREKPASAPMKPLKAGSGFASTLRNKAPNEIAAIVAAKGSLSDGEQDRVIEALFLHRLRSTEANTLVTLKPASDDERVRSVTSRANPWMHPDAAQIQTMRVAVARWIKFMAQRVRGREIERLDPSEWFSFGAVLEHFDKFGTPKPLHAHLVLRVPPEKLILLKSCTDKVWSYASKSSVPEVDVRPIYNIDGLSRYFEKKLWMHDHSSCSILPEQLEALI